jgi:hypothetical protein
MPVTRVPGPDQKRPRLATPEFLRDAVPVVVDPGPPASGPAQAIAGRIRQARLDLTRLGVPSRVQPAIRALDRLERYLSRPQRLAIAGESNSGKTSIANLLLGLDSLPTAAWTNTRLPTRIVRAAEPIVTVRHKDGQLQRLTDSTPCPPESALLDIEVGLPLPILAETDIIDCVGLSQGTAPRATGLEDADAVLWCTPITQAWRGSEATLWSTMPKRLRARSLLVVSFADLVDDVQRAQVVERLTRDAAHAFGGMVVVSARQRDSRPKDRDALSLGVARLLAAVTSERASAVKESAARIAARTLARLA